jgi:3-phosphoshikimate 1-carboxyvinyltransferase
MFEVSSNAPRLSVKIPGNKSQINRLLILSFLSQSNIKLNNVNFCDDVNELIEIGRQLGIEINEDNKSLEVRGFISHNSLKGKELKLNLGNAGTTIRFVLPLLALSGAKFELDCADSFKSRPIKELLDNLRLLDTKISSDSFPMVLEGNLKLGSKLEVDCSKTTQYYSAFLLLSSHFDMEVKSINVDKSQKYIEQTQQVIKEFESSTVFNIPIDASSYSYAYAYGLSINEVEVVNFKRDEYQADWKLIDFINYSNPKHIIPLELGAFGIDVSQCLDLFPTFVFLASYALGTSEISGLDNLKFKESDRLSESIKLLELFEIEHSLNGDKLSITGRNTRIKKKVTYDAPSDHRMIMTAFLFMKKNFGGIIHNEQHVNKSFPDFFETFNS